MFFFSGGTGRTGAIILADQCLRRLINENKIDVFSTLKRMRQERVNMVDKVVSEYCLVLRAKFFMFIILFLGAVHHSA
jgi:protein tyrosine phosphatase